MMSEFSSLIQLFAAIYLTMCFDNQFLRRFWAQDYSEKIDTAFKTIAIPDLSKERLKKKTEAAALYEERRMRKRGTLMFILTVFLLVVIGFEPGILKYLGSLGLSWCYLVFAVLLIVFNIFDDKIMKRWLWEYFILFILMLLFFLSVIFLPYFKCYQSHMCEYNTVLIRIAKVTLLLAVIAPAVAQLFRNWLYARYYLPYIMSLVMYEEWAYNSALLFNPQKQKVEGLDERYRDVAKTTNVLSSEDRPITQFVRILDVGLADLKFFPSFGPLVRISWNEFLYLSPSNCKRKRLYGQFCKENTHLEFEDLDAEEAPKEIWNFCSDKNVSPDAIWDYYKRAKSKERKKKNKAASKRKEKKKQLRKREKEKRDTVKGLGKYN